MFSLNELTSPLSADEFLSRYWTREAVYLRDPQRTFDNCFGWDALNAIVNSDALTFPNTVMSRETGPVPAVEYTKGGDGRRIDPSALLNLYREGASITIKGADAFWRPLRAVVTGLQDTFFEAVHTNVYLSPSNIQGRTCHYDLEEVLVLQVQGQKRWRVFRPAMEFPVEPWRLEDAPDKTSEPYLDVVLVPGDVLYVPRGHWHYAIAQDSQSLHVTIGVICRKGDVFLDWLAPALRGDEVWRRNVPLMAKPTLDGAPPSSKDVREWASALRNTLLEKLSEPGLLERFTQDVFANAAPIVDVHLPADGEPAFRVEGMTFGRPAGQRHVVAATDGGALINVAGSEVELQDVDPRLLAHILGSSSFTIQDLEHHAKGVSREELTDILETLVRSGLLQATPAF